MLTSTRTPDAAQSPHTVNRRSASGESTLSIVDRDMKTGRRDLINITVIANFQS